MVKAKVELQRKGDGWQVKHTTIDYDGQEVQRLGAIFHVMGYEEAVKEAKRWTMLMVRERNRKETEDDIVLELEPSLPPKHILKLQGSCPATDLNSLTPPVREVVLFQLRIQIPRPLSR